MRPFPVLLLAAFTALAVASSAQAVPCNVPPLPTPPPCPVFPEPATDEHGILAEAKRLLHTATQANCTTVDGVEDFVYLAYVFAVDETNVVTNTMMPVVDGTQDNACVFVYGDPEYPSPACQPIVPECPATAPPY